MDKANTVNAGIPRETHERVSDYCERKRMSLRGTVGAVVDWFLSQPSAVQRWVLNDLDDEEDRIRAAYADALEALARGLRQPRPLGGKLKVVGGDDPAAPARARPEHPAANHSS